MQKGIDRHAIIGQYTNDRGVKRVDCRCGERTYGSDALDRMRQHVRIENQRNQQRP